MKRTFTLLLLVAVLGSCKKDSESSSKTDLLTSHNWKLAAQNITVTSGGATTTSTTIDACNQDDSYKFNNDKSFILDAGATKCAPSDPQQQVGSWAFTNNEQNLTLTLPSQLLPGDFQIKELSASTLHLYTSQSLSGTTYTVEVTFAPR